MAHGGTPVVHFDDLGVVGLLVGAENREGVLQKAHHWRGALLELDAPQSADLLRTLYVFLENGGNLERTMRLLSLSMSGLRYRIGKIERLTGRNLRDAVVGHQMFFALQTLLALGEMRL